jgi:hypothetical protein
MLMNLDLSRTKKKQKTMVGFDGWRVEAKQNKNSLIRRSGTTKEKRKPF